MTKADASDPPAPEATQHRNLQDGALRAAIFGISDGLVTNVSLILGVAGADAVSGTVRLAGLAGMIAGAFSMAAGEFVSMAAQRELLEREIEVEREALEEQPARVRSELVSIFTSRGISQELAEEFTDEVTRTPKLALETYARAGLGVDPMHLGSPVSAAASSFVSFSVGAIIPLLPWFFLEGNGAVGVSILLGALTAIVIGGAIGASTGRSPVASAVRQLGLGALAGGFTYVIGALLGVQVS